MQLQSRLALSESFPGSNSHLLHMCADKALSRSLSYWLLTTPGTTQHGLSQFYSWEGWGQAIKRNLSWTRSQRKMDPVLSLKILTHFMTPGNSLSFSEFKSSICKTGRWAMIRVLMNIGNHLSGEDNTWKNSWRVNRSWPGRDGKEHSRKKQNKTKAQRSKQWPLLQLSTCPGSQPDFINSY